MKNSVYHGDCFDFLSTLSDQSVDMVLIDPPYGTTACKRDKEILNPEKVLNESLRVIKDDGVIAIFAQGLFAAKMMLTAEKYYRYKWIWKKTMPVGFLSCKKKPLRGFEEVLIFYKKQPKYNPQYWFSKPRFRDRRENYNKDGVYGNPDRNYVSQSEDGRRYPLDVIEFSNSNHGSKHPTQKPVSLLEYLIKTYTVEGDVVLDFCCGSGSSLVASKNLGRMYLGCEKEEQYYKITKERLGV